MRKFAELFERLDQTTKTLPKISALSQYLDESSDEDKMWTIALLSGRRPKRSIQSNYLKEWVSEEAGVPFWLFEGSYHVVGDLGETIALLLPYNESKLNYSLNDWMYKLEELRDMEVKQKKDFILRAWRNTSKQERFLLNKLIGGGFRIGVSQKTIVKALAKLTGKEESELSHRLMGDWTPQTHTYEQLILSDDNAADASKPYPFYLAYQLDDPDDIDFDPEIWQAERKWDGIRGQLIKREDEIFVWSRGEELVTDKYPEYEGLADLLPNGTAIDGEILPFSDGKPLPFHLLQKRIGRKNISSKLLGDVPVILMAYDLLEFEGNDIRHIPLKERRQKLEELVESTSSSSSVLQLSPKVDFFSGLELMEERKKSRSFFSEGIMLKKRASEYKVGRKKGDWWKWKVDPLVIDAVMIYAMRGHGRRANLYTDYTFAVWKGEELVPFTKAYSGLTDSEFKEVDRFVKKNTLEKFGPVRSVKPELVFEIAFEGINKSSRHKSGVALRFPRMSRWRKDKKVEEANTLEDLNQLLDAYGNN
ncbi:MAG: ATP-dependent DNA ligase [Bacteroidota bacterium]